VADNAPTPFVAHPADLDSLKAVWTTVLDGSSQTVQLTAPLGGGKRAIVGDLCRAAIADTNDDVLLWRINVREEDEGMAVVLRAYAALFQAVSRSQAFRGKVEMALNSQLPSQPARVQGWYQSFIDGLRKAKPAEDGKVQVNLPKDNPLVGLIEIATGIARKFPVVLDVQGLHNSHSVGLMAFLEALIIESDSRACRLLSILSMEPIDEAAKAWMSPPLMEMITRFSDKVTAITLQPWGEAEVSQYLSSHGLSSDAGRIAEIADGRPGFIAELTDHLKSQDRLGDDLSGITMANLIDLKADESELEIPETPETSEEEGKRKYAGPDDAERVAHLAALLGVSFPSSLVADMGGYVRDSVDDLMDATDQAYKELQYSEALGTWIYQFKQALFRESVIARHTGEEAQETARRVATFIERFLAPRGHGYVVKTLRLYAENGAPERAAILRGMAIAGDKPTLWAMAQDLIMYFDELVWPDAMRRTIYMNLIERMVAANQMGPAEKVWNDAMAWATDREDRRLQGWLLFSGSRMDFRRQDLFRARDRADDALKIFKAEGETLKTAELHNHIAMIALADGKPEDALKSADAAEATADLAVVKANAEYIRGLAAKRDRGTLPTAIEHFKKANELAGSVGQGPLALEAGMQLGECLLISGQTKPAAEVLGRVGQIAQALQDPAKERAAAALLGQAHATLKNFEAAVQFGERALQLTRNLKMTQVEPVDLYNLGFFNLMLGRSKEAVKLFQESRKGADAANPAFQKELLYNLATALMKENDVAAAEDAFKAAAGAAEAIGDLRKLASAHQQLGLIAGKRGDTEVARHELNAALAAASQGDLAEAKEAIEKQLASLS
jgi:tetratricopeptide (TPR) repeat protein